ncbi:MAG: hypothetical protein NC390_03805 [Fusobacterium sp.]|nr:hypothetical protein [Fusobacterium sp.]
MGNLLVNAVNLVKRAKYGQQIGQVSKSGLACYGKSNKAGKLYTTVNAKTGEIVKTKQFANIQKRYHDTFTYDAKGDLIASTTVARQPNGFGLASHNSKAYEQRVISEKYNSFGQTVDHRDVTFTPNSTKPKAFIHSNINGKEYGTYLNTVTGEKRTYQCIG